jgi:DNA repair protein RecN (Recombination protein N)
MLTRLRISQYALIDDVEVPLGPGLNVLTGETGAGKSILVEGLGLLLGARASSLAIREGADRATIEGVFAVDGEETLVRREIYRDRSTRCSIDGELATARMLQQRVGEWVEIHGQNEDVLLLKRAVQRDLLDAFAGATDEAARGSAERVAGLAERLADLDREHAELARAEAERADRILYLRSQVAEIAAAAVEAGEMERLDHEAALLRNVAERQRLAAEIHEALQGADGAVAETLAGLQRAAGRLAEIDPAAAAWAERIGAARWEAEELARDAAAYAERVEHDPARQAWIEERRDLLHRLARKHGPTLADVVARGAEMERELATLEASSARGTALAAEREGVRGELEAAAAALAEGREAAAARLAPAVEERLRALGMGEGRFKVEFARRRDPEGLLWKEERWSFSRGGIEEVQFLIAPNVGEPPRPLSQIASGGELSRTLLAIEAALADADRTPTLVFDEIDAGIGGEVAHRVADELADVAGHHQVVVVTHLAQIAARADRHLMVEKRKSKGRTVTTVRAVEGDARVREVSRLLGGDPDRDVSLAHAEALLAGGA